MRQSSSVVVALLGAWAGALAAENPPPSAVRVDQLAWLTGCWEASSPGRTVEEHWLAPRGETMIGVSRTVRDGRTAEYELVLIRPQDGRLAYQAHPSGQPSAVFLSRQLTETSVVFENPEHDFPQRIGYQREGDSLLAWIEGTRDGKTLRVEFPYRRVRCEERERRTETIRLRATVQDVVMLTRFTGTVIPVDVDPNYVLTVRVESVVPATAGFTPGSVVSLAIHSPTLVFQGDATKGKTYDFLLHRSIEDGEASFFSLEVSPAPTPDSPG
jgi:hypothetical protein